MNIMKEERLFGAAILTSNVNKFSKIKKVSRSDSPFLYRAFSVYSLILNQSKSA